MKARTVLVAAVLQLIMVKGFGQENGSKLSLKQCVDIALKNNIDVRQAEVTADRANVNWKQAKFNLLPDLNANANYGFNRGRSVDPITNNYVNQQLQSSGVGINAGLTLFSGLQLQNFIKQTGYAYEASKMEWQQVKDNLTLNVLIAYLNVLSNEDVLAITKAQAEVTRKQVERMEVLVKEGAVGTYQLTDLKGQLSGDEVNIVTASNALQNSKLTLAQLMNVDYNPDAQFERSDIDIIAEKYPVTPDKIYEAALQNLAIAKGIDLRVKSAQKAVSVSRGALYPSIGLNGAFNSNYSSAARTLTPTTVQEVSTGQYVMIAGVENPVLVKEQNYSAQKIDYFKQLNNNRGTFYGIGIQVPILNNFQARNRIKLAKLDLKNTELQGENTRRVIKQNIEQGYQNSNAVYNRYAALTEQVNSYQESFRAGEVRFEAGAINSTEYLLIKNNLDRARINLAQAKYEMLFRTRVLDFYQGKLAL